MTAQYERLSKGFFLSIILSERKVVIVNALISTLEPARPAFFQGRAKKNRPTVLTHIF